MNELYWTNTDVITKKNLACSPQANYTDRATAAFRRIQGVTWSAQRIPTSVNLGFLDRNTDVIRTIKYGRVQRNGHVARFGRKRDEYNGFLEIPEVK
jgi:hypothetical protein